MSTIEESDSLDDGLMELQKLKRHLDAIRQQGPTAEQLQARLDASTKTTIIIQIDQLISVLIEGARSSLESTEKSLRLQHEVNKLTVQMKWLGAFALFFAVVACMLSGWQLIYAQRADARETKPPPEQSMPTTP